MGDASSPMPSLQEPCEAVRAGLPSTNPTASFWQTSHPNPFTHHRSTPDFPSHADIVVIGTGISGTFAVDEFLTQASSHQGGESNLDLVVLEARTLCSAATGRNGGHLHPIVHAAPADILDFEMANFNHVSDVIRSRDIQCDFRRLSGCLGFWNQTYFDEAKQALAQMPAALSHLVRVVEDEHGLRELGLTGDAVGAIVQSVAASLSPYKLCVSMWQDLLAKYEDGKDGVRLNLQTTTPVTSFSWHGENGYNYILHTPRGLVHAKTLVLATNGYTSHLLPDFAALIRPVQAQMSALVPISSSEENRKLIPMSYGFEGVGTMDRVMSDYLVQGPYFDSTGRHSGGELMFGGGRHLAFEHGENTSDDSFADHRVQSYLQSLPERLNLLGITSGSSKTSITASAATKSKGDNIGDARPAETLDLVASWTGIIGHSADGYPWVGAVPDHPGVFLCAGYTGHGMTNAPLCGRYIANALLKYLDSVDGTARPDFEHGDLDGAKPEMVLDVPREYLVSPARMQRLAAGR